MCKRFLRNPYYSLHISEEGGPPSKIGLCTQASLLQGVVYIYKSERSSNYRANYYGMAYKKQVCLKTLGQFGEKPPLNQQNQTLVSPLLKLKNVCRPNIGMWGVYPEAMACNVGVCSDINLGERILR